MSLSFRSVSTELTIHLPPAGLSDVSSAVASQLNSYLFQYSPECGGVIVSYKSVRYVNKLGQILYDRPWIHFQVSVEFLVLQLSPGEFLSGQVVAINAHALTLLVAGVFNAVISRTRGLPQYMRYSPSANRFVDSRKAGTGAVTGKAAAAQAEPEEGKEVLTKKAAKKAAKLAEKEAKRAAYFASIGQAPPVGDSSSVQSGELEGSIGMGDSLVFQVIGVEKSHSREYFSIQAKFVGLDPRGPLAVKQENGESSTAVKEEEEGEAEQPMKDEVQAEPEQVRVKKEKKDPAPSSAVKVKKEKPKAKPKSDSESDSDSESESSESSEDEKKKKKKKSVATPKSKSKGKDKSKEKEKSKSKKGGEKRKRSHSDSDSGSDSSSESSSDVKKTKKEKKHKKQKSKE